MIPQLCPGEDLPCCRSCLRLVENHPPEKVRLPLLVAHTQDGKCIQHMGIPDTEPRKQQQIGA